MGFLRCRDRPVGLSVTNGGRPGQPHWRDGGAASLVDGGAASLLDGGAASLLDGGAASLLEGAEAAEDEAIAERMETSRAQKLGVEERGWDGESVGVGVGWW